MYSLDIKESYAEFIQSFEWDYFITVTFKKPRKDKLYAIKKVWDTLYWSCHIDRAFIVAENFKGQDECHIHGLIFSDIYPYSGRHSMYVGKQPSEVWRILFENHGRSKVEAINKKNNVAAYCAKYIMKEDDAEYEILGKKEHWYR